VPKKPIAKELEAQIVQLTEALQRERADAANLRRRHDEQIASLRTSVKAHVVKDLLPVVDNIERALKHLPAELETKWDLADEPREWVKGVKKILEQFEKTLTDMGVERVKTVGEPFDPHLHEAVSAEEGDGPEIVSEELQAGYKIGDDVIRHAMVRVKG
jgi:molecular chaperone GrpE